jgi:hypothetical protein
MAIRLERSGGLIFIRGCKDEPEEGKGRGPEVCLWLALVVLALGIYFVPAKGFDLAAVNHTFNALMGAIR